MNKKSIPQPPTPHQIAQWCVKQKIVPLPLRGKAPFHTDWPNYQPNIETDFTDSALNIGAILGTRSGGLVDVDLDWPETETLAPRFLPASWAFGRRTADTAFHLRHIMYSCAGIQTRKWDAPPKLFEKPLRIVEILSDGTQVVLPGSTHLDTGQRIEWRKKPNGAGPVEIASDDLLQRVHRLAGTALLVRLWPDLDGTRHDLALPLAGACHHAGWQRADIENMFAALIAAANDREKRDRVNALLSTLDNAESGAAVTGLPRLSELLPAPVTDCLAKWWQLGQPAVELTFNGVPLEQAAPAATQADTSWAKAEWPELLEFETISVSTQHYPIEALGPTMAAAVHEVCRVQQVPVPLAAQSVLTTASGAVQSLYDIEMDLRRIPLSLWMVAVANAGERKTSTDQLVRKQTDVRRKEAAIAWRVQMDAWKAQRADKEAGDPGPKPRQPSWISTRGTAEGLLKQLANHWPATILSTADAGSWFGGYSMREGRATATISVLSDLWSGEAHTTVLASSDEAMDLFNRRLAISFMLQPNIAADLFYTELLRGQGFLSRCLPAFPPSTIGTRLYRAPGDTPALQKYWNAIDRLLLQQPDMDLDTGELHPEALMLTDDAHRLWIVAHDAVECSQATGREHEALRDVANKMAEQALRLAGVCAAVEGRPDIDGTVMQGGIDLMHYYLAEWLTLAGKLQAHKTEVTEARQLWVWIEKRRNESGQHTFNLRDAYKNGPRIIRNRSQKARELVAELLRRGYVRRQGRDYEIRPAHET